MVRSSNFYPVVLYQIVLTGTDSVRILVGYVLCFIHRCIRAANFFIENVNF